MTELPQGWAEVRTDEAGILDLGRQRSPKYHNGPNMKPYLRVANVFEDRIDASDVKTMHFEPEAFERSRLHLGDVLLNEGQSPEFLGRPAIYRGEPPDVAFTNSLIRFRASHAVTPEWALVVFRHHMHSGRFARESRITTNIAHLSANRLAAVEFRVPPIAEQKRIVTAMDEAFSKLDAGEVGLRTARRLLKRMREAVLTAAVTGRLLPQDPTDTPATKLLADLGVELFGEDEPGDLPDGWCWSTLGDVSTSAGYGSSVKCGYDAAGVGVLRIPNIQRGRIDLIDLKRAPEGAIPDDLLLAPGDLLVVRTNGSRDLIGRSAPVTQDTGCSFASYLIRFRLNSAVVEGEYISLMLSSSAWRRRLEASAASSAGQYNLSLRTLEPMAVALPPLAEQCKIVAEVERQVSFVEACERAVDACVARSAGLRRSVLKSAFEGRLVPQDPSDEPASSLLARVGGPPSARSRKQ